MRCPPPHSRLKTQFAGSGQTHHIRKEATLLLAAVYRSQAPHALQGGSVRPDAAAIRGRS
jgi:hypothetical protein